MIGYAVSLVTAIYMVFFSEEAHILYSSIINKTIAVLFVFLIGLGAYRVGGWMRRVVPSDVVTTDQGCLLALPLMLIWTLGLNLVLCVVAAFLATALYFSAFGTSGNDLAESRMEANLSKSHDMVEGWKAAHKAEIEKWERDYPIAYGPNYAQSALAKIASVDEDMDDRIYTAEQQSKMLKAKILWEAHHSIDRTAKNSDEFFGMMNAADFYFAELKREGICFLVLGPDDREWRPCYKPSPTTF